MAWYNIISKRPLFSPSNLSEHLPRNRCILSNVNLLFKPSIQSKYTTVLKIWIDYHLKRSDSPDRYILDTCQGILNRAKNTSPNQGIVLLDSPILHSTFFCSYKIASHGNWRINRPVLCPYQIISEIPFWSDNSESWLSSQDSKKASRHNIAISLHALSGYPDRFPVNI